MPVSPLGNGAGASLQKTQPVGTGTCQGFVFPFDAGRESYADAGREPGNSAFGHQEILLVERGAAWRSQSG